MQLIIGIPALALLLSILWFGGEGLLFFGAWVLAILVVLGAAWGLGDIIRDMWRGWP